MNKKPTENVLLDGVSILEFMYENDTMVEGCKVIIDKRQLDILSKNFKPTTMLTSEGHKIYMFNKLYFEMYNSDVNITLFRHKNAKHYTMQKVEWIDDKAVKNYNAPLNPEKTYTCTTPKIQDNERLENMLYKRGHKPQIEHKIDVPESDNVK